MPVVAELFAPYHQFLAIDHRDPHAAAGASAATPRKRTRAAIGHALAFRTWQHLTEDAGAGRRRRPPTLMSRLVAAAA